MMKLLLVEDNDGLREQMKWAFSDTFLVVEANDSASCMHVFGSEKPTLVCLDMGLDNIPDRGLDLIDSMLQIERQAKIIVITANTSEAIGVEAVRRGAFDYLRKPVDVDHLRVILDRAIRLSTLQQPAAQAHASAGVAIAADRSIVGQSPAMQRIFGLIKKLSQTDVNVLITGESGTGKELCARAIHYNSVRRDQPFTAINCGAIPETLLESELFGYMKGAFTGATADKKGLIETAENGTLFLDEIGDMPKVLQVKLLRFIEDQTFQPLGGTKMLHSNARIIAATNNCALAESDAAALRSDLYYRLSEFEIHLPPLRERGEDVLLIARALVARNQVKFGLPRLTLSSRTEKHLCRYTWPGNIRELENKLSRAAIMCTDQTIEPDDLQLSAAAMQALTLKAAREMFEKEFVLAALKRTGNNISAAAEILDISRPTLYDLIKKFAIQVKE
jgi:two-component system NtrC family response regulator